MNLPISKTAARVTSAAVFSLIASGGLIAHACADAPHVDRAASSPSPTASPHVSLCSDCPPIIIGHPNGGYNPDGIIVGPDEFHIPPSPRPFNGHVYSVTRSGAVTTVLEDGAPKMTISFHGNRAYIGLPGSKPLIVINVEP